ncbi:unnamed protein product [Adineta ricciae]|uniref:Uncharacterized protein n=1 Tax=Adineta ricciae TaxID=249248 RepID=A0A815GGK3_ADIRI|nr:unnamed protein product [Adineta ricciae]CAF1338551.1 unnamed protein product [Adineta ricciae]
MSIFQRLLGSSKKGNGENISTDEAIQRLSSVEDLLNKKQIHLESQIDSEKVNALNCSRQGNKRGALMALKRKKKHENALKQIDGTLITLEIQRESLQNAKSNIEVLRVMRSAAGALQKTHDNLNVDDVHDLMDDLDEQNTLAKEIANAISAPGLSGLDLYDDADLERELEELAGLDEQEDIGTLPEVPAIPIKTKVPDRKLEDFAT